MAIPGMRKIVVNIGVGEHANIKMWTERRTDLVAITGQSRCDQGAPVDAQFQGAQLPVHRDGDAARRLRMYEFMDRCCNHRPASRARLSRCADQGLDGRGNYTRRVKDQLMFLEIAYSKIDKNPGHEYHRGH